MGKQKKESKPVVNEITPVEEEVKNDERKKKKKKNREKTEENIDPILQQNTEAETASKEEQEEENENRKKKKKKKKEKINVKIETVRESPDKTSPIVGYFSTGFDPCRSLEGEEPEPQPRVGVFRHAKRSSRLQLVVRPNGSQVDFVGTNYSGEATATQVCTYALGVLDKATQTLKIVPIAANKIFRLEPRVGGSDLTENEPADVSKEELTSRKKADKLRDLTLMYSTKKSIRQAKKLESLHQKQDPKSQEDLDRKIEGIKINKEALEVAAAANNARNIPPHDMSATTPQTAYPLDKIILKGEWDYLLDFLDPNVVAVVLPDVYPSFVCHRLYKLEDIEDEEKRGRLACIYSYITHLIKFKDKRSMDGVSSAKYHKIPNILSQKFVTIFADSDSKRLSDEKRDLLISYVLVLTLFADDFRTDPSDIAKDLRMNAVALRPHYEHLGCKFGRQGDGLLATLPVPLQFPVVRRKRRR